MNYYVYAYCDYTPTMKVGEYLFPGCPFYIGYGCRSRAFYHLKEAKELIDKPITGNLHKIRTIQKFLKNGEQPLIIILRAGLSKDEAKNIEQDLISKLGHKKSGGVLTNIAKGGDGGDTLSQHPRRGKWGRTFDHRGEKNPLFGRLGANNPKSKHYTFILPDGNTISAAGGSEVNQVIKDLKVSRNGIFDVIKGRKPDHRGIRVVVS